jgi:TolB-like protein/class 3 adenylate cyclase/Tfp pilus assembly protein PilF
MSSDPVERRLAALLSADVVGYSRLMAEDEAGTIRTLTAYRQQMATLVQEHRGRVVDSPGDNLLAEFPTALDAVQGAVEIQRVIEARNADLPTDRRMEFRIGVHMGDVSVEGERLYGDGVNIAARLEGLAEPGGICISQEVHGQVATKLDLHFDDLGEQSVKNIPKLVRVYRVRTGTGAEALRPGPSSRTRIALWVGAPLVVTVLALVSWWALAPDSSPGPSKVAAPPGGSVEAVDELTVPGFGDRPAIAVLPFENLSGDPEQEYFADGVAEDLITRLSLWRSFPVIARNSSFIYKGQAVDVKRVREQLGVRYVVEGSVRRSGDRVRISAQLIDSTTGHHVWANTYDREIADIFALQDEISAAIAASMMGELERAEGGQAVRPDPASLESWDLYQRGLWHFRRETAEDSAKARAFFEQALELDPYFATAHAQVAATHYWDIVLGWADSPERSLGALSLSARRAVELDPRGYLGQAYLASAFSLEGDGERQRAAARRAVELNPSSPLAHTVLGWALLGAGRTDEAIAVLKKGLRLSPYGPETGYLFDDLTFAYNVAGRYTEANEAARRLIELRPGYLWGYVGLAVSFAGLDRLADARRALNEARRLNPDFSEDHVRKTCAFWDPDVLERFLAPLRKAGLEE